MPHSSHTSLWPLQEVLRSQFVGIRIARRELAPGMVEKLAMQAVHTIELLGSNPSSWFVFIDLTSCDNLSRGFCEVPRKWSVKRCIGRIGRSISLLRHLFFDTLFMVYAAICNMLHSLKLHVHCHGPIRNISSRWKGLVFCSKKDSRVRACAPRIIQCKLKEEGICCFQLFLQAFVESAVPLSLGGMTRSPTRSRLDRWQSFWWSKRLKFVDVLG